MRFRFGLFTGLAAGYVLGAKAGQQRYDQIVAAVQSFRSSETARSLEGGLKDAWSTAQEEWPALRQVDDVIDRLADEAR